MWLWEHGLWTYMRAWTSYLFSKLKLECSKVSKRNIQNTEATETWRRTGQKVLVTMRIMKRLFT